MTKLQSFKLNLLYFSCFTFWTWWRRSFIFQTLNSARSNSWILNYRRFTPSGCIVVVVRKLYFCYYISLSWFLHFPLISINFTFIKITRIKETLNIYFQLFLNNKILIFFVYFYISRFWEISLNLHPGFTGLILPEDWKVALQQNKL